jgi:hypothetical protein
MLRFFFVCFLLLDNHLKDAIVLLDKCWCFNWLFASLWSRPRPAQHLLSNLRLIPERRGWVCEEVVEVFIHAVHWSLTHLKEVEVSTAMLSAEVFLELAGLGQCLLAALAAKLGVVSLTWKDQVTFCVRREACVN